MQPVCLGFKAAEFVWKQNFEEIKNIFDFTPPLCENQESLVHREFRSILELKLCSVPMIRTFHEDSQSKASNLYFNVLLTVLVSLASSGSSRDLNPRHDEWPSAVQEESPVFGGRTLALLTPMRRGRWRSERVDVGSREPWSGTISPAGRVSLHLALQSTRGRRTKPNLWPGLDPGHWTSLWGAQKQNVTGLKGRSREQREFSHFGVLLLFKQDSWFTEFYCNTLLCRVLEKRNRPSVKTGPLSSAGGFLSKVIKVGFLSPINGARLALSIGCWNWFVPSFFHGHSRRSSSSWWEQPGHISYIRVAPEGTLESTWKPKNKEFPFVN